MDEKRKIYIRNSDGELEPVTEKQFETEDLLQELIGQHPELLSGEQMHPDDPLRWILIRREMPIEGWALDHLLIDQHSRPTLVEVKRGSNREIRRNIVGQMLDYAATAAGIWSGDGVRRAFEEDAAKRGIEPIEELSNLLAHDDEQDEEEWVSEFWERVATNLAANRMRLLFVADEIPLELERVVKFLNEQTRDNLEVLAIEVKQYPGRFGDALVSRVIGQVDAPRESRAVIARLPLTRGEFVDQFPREMSDAINSLFNAAQNAGATLQWATTSVAIYVRCSLHKYRVQVARFWSPTHERMKDHTFSFYYWKGRETEYHPDLQEILDRYVDKLNQDGFTTPPPGRNDFGISVNAEDFVKHVDLLTSRLTETLADIRAL